jgi:hypothetical protein
MGVPPAETFPAAAPAEPALPPFALVLPATPPIAEALPPVALPPLARFEPPLAVPLAPPAADPPSDAPPFEAPPRDPVLPEAPPFELAAAPALDALPPLDVPAPLWAAVPPRPLEPADPPPQPTNELMLTAIGRPNTKKARAPTNIGTERGEDMAQSILRAACRFREENARCFVDPRRSARTSAKIARTSANSRAFSERGCLIEALADLTRGFDLRKI